MSRRSACTSGDETEGASLIRDFRGWPQRDEHRVEVIDEVNKGNLSARWPCEEHEIVTGWKPNHAGRRSQATFCAVAVHGPGKIACGDHRNAGRAAIGTIPGSEREPTALADPTPSCARDVARMSQTLHGRRGRVTR